MGLWGIFVRPLNEVLDLGSPESMTIFFDDTGPCDNDLVRKGEPLWCLEVIRINVIILELWVRNLDGHLEKQLGVLSWAPLIPLVDC